MSKQQLNMKLDVILMDLLNDKYMKEIDVLKTIIDSEDWTLKQKEDEFKKVCPTFDNWLVTNGYAEKKSLIITKPLNLNSNEL